MKKRKGEFKMASGKLFRKLRKKLGMTQSQPVYQKREATYKQQVQTVQTVPTKSCCGRGR
jgi:hypothetical protein